MLEFILPWELPDDPVERWKGRPWRTVGGWDCAVLVDAGVPLTV
ncbi:hypothetical protein AB0H97_37230 [Streptomyces sp. NPDC050788]